jgi:hypothetical protein
MTLCRIGSDFVKVVDWQLAHRGRWAFTAATDLLVPLVPRIAPLPAALPAAMVPNRPILVGRNVITPRVLSYIGGCDECFTGKDEYVESQEEKGA